MAPCSALTGVPDGVRLATQRASARRGGTFRSAMERMRSARSLLPQPRGHRDAGSGFAQEHGEICAVRLERSRAYPR